MRRRRTVAILGLAVCSVVLGRPASAEVLPWRVKACTYRVALVCPVVAAGTVQEPVVFFLDLNGLGTSLSGVVDTAGMRLVASGDGGTVPFSLDHRYGDRHDLPPPNPRRPEPNGYWGRKYPAAEEMLRRLGFLSFRAVAGEARYDLYFTLSGAKTTLRARPEPAIRPWWIEQCRDPTFAMNKSGGWRPDYYASWGRKGWRHVKRRSPEGERCFEVSLPKGGRLITMPGLFDFDRRIAGRRVILYHLIYAEKGLTGRNIYLPLPSGLRKGPRYIAAYYSFREIPPKTWYALCVEGRVSEHFEKFEKRLYANYNGPCLLGALHVQFPPDRATVNAIDIGTDIASPGDRIPLSWSSNGRSCLLPVKLVCESRAGEKRTMSGRRVESWPEGFSIEGHFGRAGASRALRVMKAVAKGGETWRGGLTVADVKPGNYSVRLVVRSRRTPSEVVARLVRDVRVIEGPFPARGGGK